MRRLAVKIAIFSLPFFAVPAMELLFFPIDFFNFRVWESIKTNSKLLPGPFYPNVKLFKVEEGDLGHHTKYADKKSVYWETDRHGYRIKAADREDFRIIIVGDSIVVGSGLTQEDTLASALERRLGVDVYPFAPATFSQFAGDARFAIHPPAVVVFSQIERNIPNLKSIKEPRNNKFLFLSSLFRRMQSVWDISFIQSMAVYADRASKMSGINYVNSRLAPVRQPKTYDGRILFMQGEIANQPKTEKTVERTLSTIGRYDQWCRERGIRFIFLPIPNKENIYYDLLPGKMKPAFLRVLINRLCGAGIDTIDTQSAFETEYRKRGRELYLVDDTHMNRDGVELTARHLDHFLRHRMNLSP